MHGMPSCCDAMQAEIKPGDTLILSAPVVRNDRPVSLATRELRQPYSCVVLGINLPFLISWGTVGRRPSSPDSQPAAFELNGSDATTTVFASLHLGHSNNLCSNPTGPGETLSRIMRLWQREQRGRSIAVRYGGELMTLP
jgi:hypothetical protein